MRNQLLAAMGAMLLLPAFASAQKADTDGNGAISLAEFQASRGGALMGRDTDGDGRLSAAEWSAGGKKRAAKPANEQKAGKAFSRLDTSRDGFLTKSEIGSLLARRFAKMDANGDGSLSPEERSVRRKPATKPDM